MIRTQRVLRTLMLAAVVTLGACDRGEELGEMTGPSVQHSSTTDVRSIEFVKRKTALTGDVTYVSQSPVGKAGAVLRFGNHTLTVPEGSVSNPTYFSATLRAGSEVRVDLRAWETSGLEVKRFARAVVLTFDISDAANTSASSGLAVYYHAASGSLEKMPSTVDAVARTLSGYLDHFSDYSGGFPRDSTPPQP